MAQNKEKNPSSEFIHSAHMRRASKETKSNAKLLGRDSAQVSVSAELFIMQYWLSVVISKENPLNLFVSAEKLEDKQLFFRAC